MPNHPNNKLEVFFYRTSTGAEPVREWLNTFAKTDKKTIGEDIKTVQFGWPLGMPLVRSLGNALWEIRSKLSHGRISRIIFFMQQSSMVLLHGFIKKTQKTPLNEIEIALRRKKDIEQ